jgi:hypothetical protein
MRARQHQPNRQDCRLRPVRCGRVGRSVLPKPILHRVMLSIGAVSVVGTLLVMASARPVRASSRPFESVMQATYPQVECVTAVAVDEPSLSRPPVSSGAFRPSHFSMASVSVAIERLMLIRCMRVGGLYGP